MAGEVQWQESFTNHRHPCLVLRGFIVSSGSILFHVELDDVGNRRLSCEVADESRTGNRNTLEDGKAEGGRRAVLVVSSKC